MDNIIRYHSVFNELDIIGFGSFGIACRAIDKNNNKIFAIKKVPINEQMKEKALKEIKIFLELKSERIVKLESFWFQNNYYFRNDELKRKLGSSHELFKQNNNLLLHIQMELCYKTLKEIIEIMNKELNQKKSEVMTPLGFYMSSEIFIEILESVDYLHKQNVIHRDLKPSNILITDGSVGRFVKIADFGLATIHETEDQLHTKYLGTDRYAAPEVKNGTKYDTKVDIYSLGVILQELFNVNINEQIGNNSNLEMNYLRLFELNARMLDSQKIKRPTCEQILSEIFSWAVSINGLIESTDLRNKMEVKSIEDNFHMFFIQTKYQLQNKMTIHDYYYSVNTIIEYDSVFNELDIIASGSFGIVCKAKHKNNNKIFAIKKVPINEHLKEKALREITVLSKLKSELIVKLESFWIENNYCLKHDKLLKKLDSNHGLFKQKNNLLLHIQMELCYKTLKEIIEILNKELNQKQSEIMTSLGYYISSELFIEILESVDYLHKQNVIHRDLKPNNILITDGSFGRFVRIADFGLATVHETDDQSHTKYIGTVRYAAPEVMRGRNYDTKADIFSLGIIVQELFKIDINEPIGGNSDLAMNYSNLFKLITRMLLMKKNERPDCEEILREMNSWALSLTQLTKSTNLRKNTNKKTIEESFHMYFIQTKYYFQNNSHNKLETELSSNPIKKRIEEQFNNTFRKLHDKNKGLNQRNNRSKSAIGIDLGTTYSCVGVLKRGKVHIISNNYGLKTTPSYISFKSNGDPFVGQSAKEEAHENPANTIYDVKRMIGRKYNDIDIQNDMKLWPFDIIDENGSLKVKLDSEDHRTYLPEQLSAEILSKLKNDAEKFLLYEVKSAVITVPAYFNDAQRQATKEAGILAGLNVLQILNEPTAAAIAYNHQIKEDFRKNVLIYDLGGGTFDVVVVVIENGIINVKAVNGDTHLGGVDFDQRILDFLFETFKDKFNKAIDEEKKKRALHRLKINCEKKKWELSEMSSTYIIIDVLLPGWDFKYELTRKTFDDLCIDLFEKTIKIIDETLKCAKMEAIQIDDIVLIGGSTKIPKIQALLEKYFNKPLNNEMNPDEAVAYGATIQAALLNEETFNKTAIENAKNFYTREMKYSKQALENAKKFYTREMKNHFSQLKFILIDELQALHEKYKSLSHDKLREELSDRDIPKVREQLNRSLEKSYDTFKRQILSNIPIKPAIGIDLGTSNSFVGVMNRGKVHIISNTYGLKTTPSYIAFTESGREFVGQSAKEQAHENPANTIYDVKRMIGKKYDDFDIQEDMKLWPFDVVNENHTLKVKLYSDQNITFYPVELSAKVLSRLKTDAENFLGFTVNNAVITVPAYFNDAQRQATKDAGLLAGLNVLQLLNEPTAAAIAYNHQIREEYRKNILIYDLGGGTFDVAVVVIDNETIDVRAFGGDAHLGGVDFDHRIMNYLIKTFKDEFSKNHTKERFARAKARLRNHCEKKKCELSEMSSTNIVIDVLLPGWDLKYTLERSTFEDLCIDLFKKTIGIVEQTLKSADIKACDINDVVLIGGSTKIPKIQSLLREYFLDKSLNKEISRDEAVAYGATIQAALLNGETFIDSNRSLIHDVSPFSLGIEASDKSMAIIIPRNTKIPCERTQTFQIEKYNQTSILIQIFEGENKIAKQNRLLGELIIDGLPKKWWSTGKFNVEVTIKIDEEGIMHIRGVSSNKSSNLKITEHRGRISADKLKTLFAKVFQDQRNEEEVEEVENFSQTADTKQSNNASIQTTQGITATAIYDYQAADETEISFNPEEIIANIEMIDEGWWIGECRGKIGLFPANYVQLNQ